MVRAAVEVSSECSGFYGCGLFIIDGLYGRIGFSGADGEVGGVVVVNDHKEVEVCGGVGEGELAELEVEFHVFYGGVGI